MISKSFAQDAAFRFCGDVAMPSKSPGCAEAFDAYQSDNGVGASPSGAAVLAMARSGALAWAETVTRVAGTNIPDDAYQAARAVFSERELVDLAIAISLMNAYNRMSISFRNAPQAALEKAT